MKFFWGIHVQNCYNDFEKKKISFSETKIRNLENIHPYVHEYVIYIKDGILFSGKDVLAKNNGYCESGIDICRR